MAILLNPDLEPRKIEVVWENIWYGIGNHGGLKMKSKKSAQSYRM